MRKFVRQARPLRRHTLLRIALPIISLCAVTLTVAINGCARGDDGGAHRSRIVISGADVEHGKQLVTSYNCGACHAITDMPHAIGRVGPPLTGFADRMFIAGELPNEPRNLVRWLMDPPAVEPGTVMPNMGIPAREARDIAGYLYTLR